MPHRTLDSARSGAYIKIHKVPQGIIKVQLLRFGICEGDMIYCLQRLPGGTMVVQKNRQEIALGSDLARQIFITEE